MTALHPLRWPETSDDWRVGWQRVPPPTKFVWSIRAATVAASDRALAFTENVWKNTFEDGGFGGDAGLPLRAYIGADLRLAHPPAGVDASIIGRAFALAVEGDRLVGTAFIESSPIGRRVVEFLASARTLAAIDPDRRSPGLSFDCTTYHVAGEFIEIVADAVDLVSRPALPGVFVPFVEPIGISR